MKSLSHRTYKAKFDQSQAPKKYRHNNNLKAKDDFKKNAVNGIILRKKAIQACVNGTWEVV